ncbi:MAG: lipopolysaccharide biosynthesis protein [Lachnospiraceae bacterium]|nr:lipopolysaccharide biosynthesis protein [Lachnospiraceae bacterium]
MKNKVLSGLFWKVMENGGVQGVQFVVSIVLARLLSPDEYGIISLITIFITIANVFVQSGFNTALIQKREADEVDFSSVFYLSLFVAACLYALLFLASPAIGGFYDKPELAPVLRVLSLILFFGAFTSIQTAVVSRRMQFQKLFFSSLGAVAASGFLGIVCAAMGAGVWALVVQQLSYQLISGVILWFTVRWRPGLLFSWERVKVLFSFGWKLLCSSLIDTVYNNVYGLIIGKIYNSEMLAHYDKGNQFPQLLVNNINGAIQSVMLPALSTSQDERGRMKAMVRRSITTSSFLVVPMMAGLMAVAEPMVSLLLTDKWLPCVPFLRLMCLSYAFWPIHTANLQAINAMGRSDVFLKLEIVKKIIGIAALFISIPFGIFVMVALKPAVSLISTFVNAWPNQKLLGYSLKEQWADLLPSFLLSAVMGAAVYGLSFLGFGAFATLCIQVAAGMIFYAGLAWLFKIETFRYLTDTLRELTKKTRR